jgi:hypothetical protein
MKHKKYTVPTMITGLVIATGMLIGSCSMQSSTTWVSPEMLISENTRALIDEGEQIVTETMKNNQAIKASPMHGDIETATDLMVFPYNFDITNYQEQKSFQERMRDVYYADDNIVNLYKLLNSEDGTVQLESGKTMEASENTNNTSPVSSLREIVDALAAREAASGRSSVSSGIMSAIGLLGNDEFTAITGKDANPLKAAFEQIMSVATPVGQVCKTISKVSDTVKSIIGFLRGDKDRSEQTYEAVKRIEAQVNKIGLTLDEFRYEVNVKLDVINSKMDKSIQQLFYARKDINMLMIQLDEARNILGDNITDVETAVWYQGLQQSMAKVEGFLGNLSTSVNEEDSQRAAEAIVYEYNSIKEHFDTCISEIHDIALTRPEFIAAYPEKIGYTEDSEVARITAVIKHSGGTCTYWFSYTNPAIAAPISLGDLAYLAKIITTKFLVNEYAYEKKDLLKKNKIDAIAYLETLNSRYGLAINECVKTMDDEFYTHVDNVMSNFAGLGLTDITSIEYFLDGEKVEVPTEGERIILAAYGYQSAFMDYLGKLATAYLTLCYHVQSHINAGKGL